MKGMQGIFLGRINNFHNNLFKLSISSLFILFIPFIPVKKLFA